MTLHDYVVNYICRGERGGFAAALGDAFCRADSSNQRKLIEAFPNIFDPHHTFLEDESGFTTDTVIATISPASLPVVRRVLDANPDR